MNLICSKRLNGEKFAQLNQKERLGKNIQTKTIYI